MKLILCPHCSDIVRLREKRRSCDCGKCSGQYLDGLNAVYSAEAIPLGVDNNSLMSAVRSWLLTGENAHLNAFLIAENARTFKKEGEIKEKKEKRLKVRRK